jgi:hypothetical protein
MPADSWLEILEKAYKDAAAQLGGSFLDDSALRDRLTYAALCPSNRAGARFLLAATLAKIDQPKIDIRKPFIQACPDNEKANAYPGRNYDEQYIFVTTERVESEVREYAAKQYKELGGIEIAILDCIGFLRHFLHLFYRLRTQFLDACQEMVLAQPESGVNQALKEAFLALRKAAQAAD